MSWRYVLAIILSPPVWSAEARQVCKGYTDTYSTETWLSQSVLFYYKEMLEAGYLMK